MGMRRLPANQVALCIITFVCMLMLRRGTYQIARFIITSCTMLVFECLTLQAGYLLPIAGFLMYMAFHFLSPANQNLFLCVTCFGMDVRRNFRQCTGQISFRIVTVVIVHMHYIIRKTANQVACFILAFYRMRMHLHVADEHLFLARHGLPHQL
ncbi:MAG: hypothetical protein HFJ05_10810 [Eubacterium sp.]|nr:hypothetical protein [Eubacterium sp.]